MEGDKAAGIYVLNDAFKPHFSEFNTPAGHNLTMVSPGDHRHHKGVMYALVAEDVCFWEEEPGSGHCGIQEILSTEAIDGGIRQTLLWREEQGHLHTYTETRTIICVRKENAFEWTWKTERKALRDHRLIQSKWAHESTDGRLINYHGLGIRLPWMWSFGADGSDAFGWLEVDGQPTETLEAHGNMADNVGIWGIIDGQWDRTKARVSMSHQHGFPWYMIRGDFAYIASGPSVAGPVDVKTGQTFSETYVIRAEDIS